MVRNVEGWGWSFLRTTHRTWFVVICYNICMKQIIDRFRWRQLFFFLAVVLLGLLIIRNLGRFGVFVSELARVNWLILAPIVLIRYLSYQSNAKFFEHYLAIFNKKIAPKRMLQSVVAMNFVNTVFPLGTISGTTYLSRTLKDKVNSKTVIIGQVVYQTLSAIAYLSFMLVAFVLLMLSNNISRGGFRFIVILIFSLILVGVTAIFLVANRRLAEFIILTLMRPINKLLGWFGQSNMNQANLKTLINQFYETFDYLLKNYRLLKVPFLYVWLGVFWEICSIYIVALAFHQFINPGVITAGYIIALLASLLAIFTSGVGVYEATMTTVFVALGMPLTTAVPVVLVYRVIAMWLFLPIGLVVYRRTLRGENSGK